MKVLNKCSNDYLQPWGPGARTRHRNKNCWPEEWAPLTHRPGGPPRTTPTLERNLT